MNKRTGVVRSQAPIPLTVIVQVPAEIVMYNISEPELENIVAGSSPLNLTFFGIGVGALITILITILAVKDMSERIFAVFIALLAVSVLSTAYFALKAKEDFAANSKRLQSIKSRRLRLPG